MKKLLFLCLAYTLVATSCNKSKDDVPEPERTNLPTRFVSQAGTNDSLVQTFTYDGNNRVTRINQSGNSANSPRILNFFYNADGSLAYFDDDAFGRFRFTLNSAGKIIGKKSYGLSGTTETLRDTYVYTYNGSTVTENYTPQANNGFIQKYTYDVAGNLTRIDGFTKSSPGDMVGVANGSVVYSNYDNKKSTSAAIPAAAAFPRSIVNNPGMVNYGGTYVSNFVYVYNADGYVIKRTENGSDKTLYEYRRL